ncbi:MAG: MBL fold metallo-hydrolase [Bacteroidales bacterium]|nr:MBL fold metallo-hydrolase [Bacteroidales bacterium]
MSRLILPVLLAATLGACAQAPESPYPVEQFRTPAGKKVSISMIHHASLAIDYKGYQIQVDPVGKMGQTELDYTVFPKADCILITHEHGDHYNPDTIEMLSKDGTRVILNPATQEKFGKGEAVSNGQKLQVGPFGLAAVPAYNNTEGHLQLHPKGRDNGYILDFDGLKVYISGDTEDIEEMAGYGPVDVAFLSANQPYTMTPEQCVRAALVLKPKVLIPYHLSNTDMQSIKDALDAQGSGIDVRLFEELR